MIVLEECSSLLILNQSYYLVDSWAITSILANFGRNNIEIRLARSN